MIVSLNDSYVSVGDDDMIDNDNLILVIEECSEVIKAATKIMRFGVNDSHPTYHDWAKNSDVLTVEVGQLMHCIGRLELDPDIINIAIKEKEEKLKIYGPEGTYLAKKVRE